MPKSDRPFQKHREGRGQAAVLIPLLAMLGLQWISASHFVKLRWQTAAQSAAIAGAAAAQSLTMTCGTGSTHVPCQAATSDTFINNSAPNANVVVGAAGVSFIE